MSDSIDYDELDKAVNEAIRAKSSKKAPVSTPAAKPISAAKKPAVSRGQYIDFVRRPVNHVSNPNAHKITPPAPTPVAEKPHRVMTVPTVSSSMPKYQTKNRTAVNPARKSDIVSQPAVRKPVAKTTAAPAVRVAKPAQTVAKPVAATVKKPVVTPKPVTTAKAEAPVKTEPRKTVPAGSIIKPEQIINEPRQTSAAENYSIGGKTPFANPKKRPLGEISASELKSTKNTYSSRSPKTTEKVKKHTVTESPKQKSGWFWTILTLLIVAAGGGLGFLAYLIFFSN